MEIRSFVVDEWYRGEGGQEVVSAIDGSPIGIVSSEGVDFAEVLNHAREVGGPALRKMTFHERANALKAIAKHIIENKAVLYEISALTGATRGDSWVDIDGGAGTFFSYSSLARRELPNDNLWVEGDAEPLSREGTFVGRHVLSPKLGVALHINAFNFPCWGLMEKMAPSIIAGMPVVVKPATVSCFLTFKLVEIMRETGVLPLGALQLVCGSLGDAFEHLTEQDVVTFTGSAATGRKLKTHPTIVERAVPFNMEADSLNCTILGQSVVEDDPEFKLFIDEIVRETTSKAGQKCTAIRRVIVPRNRTEAVLGALRERLETVLPGDPREKGTRLGPLVGRSQREDVWSAVELLKGATEAVIGGVREFEVAGVDRERGAYFPATVLYCDDPLTAETVHAIEAFGPVTTVMPYDGLEAAATIAGLGRGSLVGSIFSFDAAETRELVRAVAPHHGRILINDRESAKESTGHGSPLPSLVHGGPGRAGGGEEMGGLRGITHFMQRTALQGSPTILTAVTDEYHRGARTVTPTVHPFRRYFEDLDIGEQLITHRRTVTEADIVNFGCLSGDHFYAHFDEIAAADSLFEKRVAHGYFVISAAAGMFVDPAPGPVLANYGLDNLRFVEPVAIGDTIQVRLTVKRKIAKDRRPADKQATGVVIWDVEVRNQRDEPVAFYDVLTLVERRED